MKGKKQYHLRQPAVRMELTLENGLTKTVQEIILAKWITSGQHPLSISTKGLSNPGKLLVQEDRCHARTHSLFLAFGCSLRNLHKDLSPRAVHISLVSRMFAAWDSLQSEPSFQTSISQACWQSTRTQSKQTKGTLSFLIKSSNNKVFYKHSLERGRGNGRLKLKQTFW